MVDVEKFSNNPSIQELYVKINAIIDALGSSGITVDQVYDPTSTNAQSGIAMSGALDDFINKQDPVIPLEYKSKQAVRVNVQTGAIRINPIGLISGSSAYYPDVLSDSVSIPTTKKGNQILDTTQVLMYQGSLSGATITFPSQFTKGTVGAYVIIGNLDSSGVFIPYVWVDDSYLYLMDNLSTGSIVTAGVPETVYLGGNAFSPSTITSTNTTNSIEIINHGGDTEVIAKLQVDEDSTANRNLFDVQTAIPIGDLNCVIFGLLTGNDLYFAEDFSIATQSETLWTPVSTDLREYLTLSIGSGLGVTESGQLYALSNLPSQTGQSGKFLKTDGTDTSWATVLQPNDNISELNNDAGYITDEDLPTDYVTLNTAQNISGKKTFLGEKAIYFKQSSASNKLGFTLYNTNNAELGALEYRPSTISSNYLLALNCPQATGGYVGFRYWGSPAINIVAPKPTTARNYYIPVNFTDGTNTVTAGSNGTVDLSSLTPSVETFTATEIETLWNSI